ncbi:MAG TPA: hypothetical protein VGJ21_03475 [Terracidiphilus sp.]|jgi:hypothetical protein
MYTKGKISLATWCGIAMLALLWIPLSKTGFAQVDAARSTSSASLVVPQQMKFAGTAPNRAGDTVEAVFRIYTSPEGGEPLWTETQRVTVDASGKYEVLLGSATQHGLPQALFAVGQARWLGVSMERGEEVGRSPLTSVAYAMKAGDAETVGGVPGRNFVTQQQLAAVAKTLAAQLEPAVLPNLSPSGTGTANYLAMWTDSSTLGNSMLYQSGAKLGIGTTTPASALHVYSGDVTIGSQALNYPTAPLGTANFNLVGSVSLMRQTLMDGSGRFNMFWNAYNDKTGNKYYATGEPATKWNIGGGGAGGTGVYVAPAGTAGSAITWNTVFVADASGDLTLANKAMNLKAGGNVGIGTIAPVARLEVNGTAQFDGLVTFAPTQTFPGTGQGTITGITTTGPLTGAGTTGSVALGLDTAALETTLNGVYAQLGADDTFTGFQTFSIGAVAYQGFGPGAAALLGFGSNGSTGTFGSSDSGSGVMGTSTNGEGVLGNAAQAPKAVGVFGYLNSANGLSGSYGLLNTDDGLSAGMWADAANGTTAALIATADDAYGAIFYNNSTIFPTITALNNAPGGATGLVKTGIATVLRAGGPGGVCGINQSGSMACTGQVKSLMTTRDGASQLETYSVQSAENWVEDYGSGHLIGGRAFVALEAAYARVVNAGMEFHVFLTPGGDCKGLYVTNKTAGGFEVHELGGGTSSIPFDYKIVAKRSGMESERLVDVTDQMKTETEGTAFKPLAHPLTKPTFKVPARPGVAGFTAAPMK